MPDEDKKKKKFNPYLAPTETEDEAKLIPDNGENMNHAPEGSGYDEGIEGDGQAGEEADGTLIEPEEESIEDEEVVDEVIAKSPEKHELKSSHEAPFMPVRPRSWSYAALGLFLILIVLDMSIIALGKQWFWTPRSIYALSHIARTIALLVTAYLWHASLFKQNLQSFRAVFVWVGGISGAVLAGLRFIADPSFWAFINMAVEPIDSALLGLFAFYSISHLTARLSMQARQT